MKARCSHFHDPVNCRLSPRPATFSFHAPGAAPAADYEGMEGKTPSSSYQPFVQCLPPSPSPSTLVSGRNNASSDWSEIPVLTSLWTDLYWISAGPGHYGYLVHRWKIIDEMVYLVCHWTHHISLPINISSPADSWGCNWCCISDCEAFLVINKESSSLFINLSAYV